MKIQTNFLEKQIKHEDMVSDLNEISYRRLQFFEIEINTYFYLPSDSFGFLYKKMSNTTALYTRLGLICHVDYFNTVYVQKQELEE